MARLHRNVRTAVIGLVLVALLAMAFSVTAHPEPEDDDPDYDGSDECVQKYGGNENACEYCAPEENACKRYRAIGRDLTPTPCPVCGRVVPRNQMLTCICQHTACSRVCLMKLHERIELGELASGQEEQ
jgi:hypothetical protein